MPNAGRLTLSWVGKDQALLATPEGGYEWVPRDDPRITEVRSLRLAEEVGGASADTEGLEDNLLVVGDSYDALRSLARLPEYAAKYRGKVKLVYIDPPFNTGQAFEHYDDALEHSVWLTLMRDRLMLVRELLAPDGSVWIHLDDSEMPYLRVLMDEIFGRSSFVATVLWQKSYTRENRTAISVSHDYIMVYSPRGPEWKFTRNILPASQAQIARYVNPDNDPRGPYKPTPMHAKAEKGRRAAQFYTITTPSGRRVDPPKGRCWLYTEARYREVLDDGRIYFGKNGSGVPTVKKYLSEVQAGLVPNTWWTHEEVGTTGTAKNEITALFPQDVPFSTPKPERLLERVVQIGSNPGDIVLDCFGGSGTTAAVAHKMRRSWVTVELSQETVHSFTRPRLEKVVKGNDRGGITEATGWESGGGFQVLEVGPSMYEVVEGRTFLADWVTNGAFAETVAGQLGFSVEHCPPFAGSKGRSRLAVVDGVIDEQVIRAVVARLGDDERAVVVGKGATAEAADLLKELSPGSRLRKAPRDLIKRGVVR